MSWATYLTKQMLDERIKEDDFIFHCPCCGDDKDLDSDEIKELIETGSTMTSCYCCSNYFYVELISEEDYEIFG